MKIVIRPQQIQDARDLHAMRIAEGARENTLGLLTNTVMGIERRIQNQTANDHVLVAEVDGRVVGIVGLQVKASPRLNHSGTLGLTIHPEFQGQGIGRQLMSAIIDLADNWLMLVRLDLEVFTDNARAIHLYESLGFVIEGHKRYGSKRHGRYDDEYFMARYNHSLVGGMQNGQANGK